MPERQRRLSAVQQRSSPTAREFLEYILLEGIGMTILNGIQSFRTAPLDYPIAAPVALGTTRQEEPTRPGALAAASNLALQETLQAGRVSSTLLSSLMAPDGRFFRAPAPLALPSAGQAGAQRPNLPLQEALEAGRVDSALLSGIMAPTPPSRPWGSMMSTGPQSTLTTAEEIMGAASVGPPSVQKSRIAQEAYQMEIQAQRQIEQRALMGTDFGHEWFG
jgi:hypothetical protein